jgi:predicted phosphodiesterase
MRIFAISDIHIDYNDNFQWLMSLSDDDYRHDILILAGDVSDDETKLAACFDKLSRIFFKVSFVPGNHELWVHRHNRSHENQISSFDKFYRVCALAADYGVLTQPYHNHHLSIYPLFSWYDFSFGQPCPDLRQRWMDFMACDWGEQQSMTTVSDFFLQQNPSAPARQNEKIITFSHFLPRIDLMPASTPSSHHFIYPVLGCSELDWHIRRLGSDIHVYGHSHVNRNVHLQGIIYHNNAYGYPSESHLSQRALRCICEI